MIGMICKGQDKPSLKDNRPRCILAECDGHVDLEPVDMADVYTELVTEDAILINTTIVGYCCKCTAKHIYTTQQRAHITAKGLD
jgi:hypothetical protein